MYPQKQGACVDLQLDIKSTEEQDAQSCYCLHGHQDRNYSQEPPQQWSDKGIDTDTNSKSVQLVN